MKEIVSREANSIAVTIPRDARVCFEDLRANITHRSTIAWGEHCTECAFPSCYTNCEFYTPRSDMHCRRFAYGIESANITDAPSLVGLTRILFRQWGKLEGSGIPVMREIQAAQQLERKAQTHDAIVAALPLPRRIGNSVAYRLNTKRKQQALSQSASLDDTMSFIIEGWLEHASPITMTVTMMPWDKSVDGLFQKQFTFSQGYNREVISCAIIRKSVALDAPFALQIEVVGDVPTQPVIFGLVDFVRIKNAPTKPTENKPEKAKTAKCVVWDLDDTVWEGTLVEDGIEGVKLKPHVVEAMHMLDARGILNSVASKNDEELALAALKHFGLSEYILFPQIGWGPKSDSVRRIAELIDIGLDTFVFVDDQAFERGEVSAAHATVKVMTPEEVPTFSAHPLFDVPVTEESKKRRFMYRDEEKRQKAATGAGTDYLGFLRGCAIELEVMPVTKESAERVYELTQRTNQLNVTGARFTREEVQTFVEGTSANEGFVLRCRDTFGDYGIIGFCVLNRPARRIEAFFMSCRVQRKRVEHAFFAWLSANLAATGATTLSITYRKTAKNIAAVKMFAELGFVLNETASGEGEFTRSLAEAWADTDIVRVHAYGLAAEK